MGKGGGGGGAEGVGGFLVMVVSVPHQIKYTEFEVIIVTIPSNILTKFTYVLLLFSFIYLHLMGTAFIYEVLFPFILLS